MNSWKRFALLYWLVLAIATSVVVYLNYPHPLVTPQLDAEAKVACVSYAPYYQKEQSPFIKGMMIDHAQIEADLKKLSKLSHCVRTYSVGQGLDYVPEAASKIGMKVMLGAWIGWTEADNQREIAVAVDRANRYPETVKALIIGNEVLLRREQSVEKMHGYLSLAKKNTHIPVTYADVWEFWLKYPVLEQDVDFVTIHILPYWEDKPVAIQDGVQHAQEIMQKLASVFHKPLFIGETGWPSAGRERSGSVPSLVNEARYIREFLQAAYQHQWQYNLIEAVDQPWKRELEGTVGGFWGIFDTQLQPKFNLTSDIRERQDGMGLMWTMLITLVAGVSLFYSSWRAKINDSTQPMSSSMRSALKGSAALSLMAGMYLYFSLDYLFISCRDPMEWIGLGGVLLTGLAIIVYVLQGLMQQQAIKPLFWLSFLFLFTAMVASWLIMIDGRYRNFPITLYWLPVLILSLGWPTRTKTLISREQKNLAALTGGLALLFSLGIVLLEPKTHTAYAWLVLVLMLAIGVLSVSKKGRV